MQSRAPSLRRCRPPDAHRYTPQKKAMLCGCRIGRRRTAALLLLRVVDHRLVEARIAALHVIDEAGIESQLFRFGCAADALHIAAGIRAVARAERFGVVPAINPP